MRRHVASYARREGQGKNKAPMIGYINTARAAQSGQSRMHPRVLCPHLVDVEVRKRGVPLSMPCYLTAIPHHPHPKGPALANTSILLGCVYNDIRGEDSRKFLQQSDERLFDEPSHNRASSIPKLSVTSATSRQNASLDLGPCRTLHSL